MSAIHEFNLLKLLSVIPEEGRADWLVSAKDSINFLKSNGKSDAVVLFASMPFVLVQSAFALNVKLLPLDRSDLLSSQIDFSDTWVIQKSYGGGEGHRVYLEPPLADAGKTLKDGELPVFRRTFYGMDRRENLEISQKLVHALGVFWIDHRSAFCRLDENGDLEDVISILSEVGSDLHDRREAVLISAKDLAEYLALSDSSLVHRFDFTRVDTASFSHWGNPERSSKGTDELAYNLGVGAGNGSWANGYQVVRPSITVDDLIAEFEEETSGRKSKEYETFVAYDWKNSQVVETSCSPEATANYFTKSDKPFETSPAFFRAEVLTRYKGDPQKYSLEDRSITCRSAWHLKTYDINEQGQVHTYLCYLAALPISEQRYWKAFNEKPKGPISKRAFETDFEGNWSSEYDPLYEVKRKVETLNQAKVEWWSLRGADVVEAARYPATDSEKEWGDEIMALDQLVVEGFVERALKRSIEVAGGKLPTHGGGLNALTAALTARGMTDEESTSVVAPLKTLHHLRSKVRGHSATSERAQLVDAVLKKHGNFRAHVSALTAQCDTSLDRILIPALLKPDPRPLSVSD